MVKYKIFAATDKGAKKTNQDSILVDCLLKGNFPVKIKIKSKMNQDYNRIRIFAVADGVSSGVNTEEASRIAVEALWEEVKILNESQKILSRDVLLNIVDSVNTAIVIHYHHEGFSDDHIGNTTLSFVALQGDDIWAVNVGDSPIYILFARQREIRRISTEHTVATEKMERQQAGSVTQLDKATLTRYVGNAYVGGGSQASVWHEKWTTANALMLCTDGVKETYNVCELLTKWWCIFRNPAAQIIKDAVKRGSQDNLSVILIQR